MFLGGFRSDMGGTKALWLADWARARGRAFVRFDYRGHGVSSGRFEEGCLGDWIDDAAEVFSRLTEGQVVLVGSSMGGWIALHLAQRFAPRVAGLVGIAAAPDFTEDGMWAAMDAAARAALVRDGQILRPSEYGEPYVITRRLIEDGRDHLVLRRPLALACPVRLIQGTDDPDVPMAVALRLLGHLDCSDAQLTLVKGGDHRLSTPADLALLGRTLDALDPGR